jgi:hypothetical protein
MLRSYDKRGPRSSGGKCADATHMARILLSGVSRILLAAGVLSVRYSWRVFFSLRGVMSVVAVCY